jgi:pyruvate formate lyase activating enzyme
MMKIFGLQKLTLLDYPGKVACTVFMGGCNFRCPYCHNASVVFMTENSEISQEEFFDFLKKRSGILDGVCITGGEPLLNEDIKQLMKKIRDMGYLIKLDTNGAFPERLKEIINDGLVDYIAMDIKNSFSKYEKTAGVKVDIEKIKESINTIMSSGITYEFRTTVVKGFHDDDSFHEIGKMISSANHYYLQSFVDSGNLIKDGLSGFDKSEMEYFCKIVSEYVPNAQIRGI